MGTRDFNPTSPGVRWQEGLTFDEITRWKPEKSLLRRKCRSAGRNNQGRITMRHRGGGERRHYRIIDFRRDKDNIPARVVGIEYDPNRTTFIALLAYRDGEKRYILAPYGLKAGDEVLSGSEVEIKAGNALPLRNLPVGTPIHAVELTPGRGAQLGRAAGAVISLVAKEGEYGMVRLPSGETRRVHLNCRSTVGQLSNLDNKNVKLGKAGKSRHLGRRPAVRGAAMNPCDHPHGGGEGKAGIGRPGPLTPWGKPTLGFKTRRGHRPSSRFIIARRGKKAVIPVA